MAYYYHREAEYHCLGKLFGSQESRETPTVREIEISSSEEDMSSSYEVEHMDVDLDEGEVNCPATPIKISVRCKLFVDESHINPSDPSEGASTTQLTNSLDGITDGRNIHPRTNPCTRADNNAIRGPKNR